MVGLRKSVMRSPLLAALILAAALVARLVVPAGYMPVVAGGGVAMEICPGGSAMTAAMAHHQPRDGDVKGRCAFADLSLPAIGGADPVQLAEALRFILAMGLLFATAVVVERRSRLRPPLRAPPAVS